MNVDVFISYHTSSSEQVVEAIVNKLEGKGIRCWYSGRHIHGGDYASNIMEALEKCKIFLLVLNRPASESAHVLNELEIVTDRLSRKEKVVILPFHIADDEINPAARYYIKRHHWIDAVKPPMQAHIEELSSHICNLLGIEDTAENKTEQERPKKEQKTQEAKQEAAKKPKQGNKPQAKSEVALDLKKTGGIAAVAVAIGLLAIFMPLFFAANSIWSVVAAGTAALILTVADEKQRRKPAIIALAVNLVALLFWFNYFVLNGGYSSSESVDIVNILMHPFRIAALLYPVVFLLQEKMGSQNIWRVCKMGVGVSLAIPVIVSFITGYLLIPSSLRARAYSIGTVLLFVVVMAWCVVAAVAVIRDAREIRE